MHSMLSTHCVEQSFAREFFEAQVGSRSHFCGSFAAAFSTGPHATSNAQKMIALMCRIVDPRPWRINREGFPGTGNRVRRC